jgi:membrane protein YdbS with pleckstrin-like domain
MHYAIGAESTTPEEKRPENATPPAEGPKTQNDAQEVKPDAKAEEKHEPEPKAEAKPAPEPYRDLKLFEGEVVKLKLSPHPFSFMHYYIHGVVMLVFGVFFAILYQTGAWNSIADALKGVTQAIGSGNGDIIAAFLVWGFFAILLALVAWRTVDDVGGWYAMLYILILIFAIVIEYLTLWNYKYLIPIYMIALAVLMLLLADRYRKSFRYYVTNHRIAIIKRFLTHDEIFLRFRNIVDLDVHQGFWARVFGYGTIIPITPGGIGTGSDSITIAGDAEKGDTLEKGVRNDRILSTTKSVATSRATPDECIYGVRDPFGVKTLVSELMDAQSEDTQLHEIHDLLKGQKAGQ